MFEIHVSLSLSLSLSLSRTHTHTHTHIQLGTQTATQTIIKAKRLLDTNDTQDWAILNETMSTRVIAAYGQSDTFGYHGATHRATTKIDFYNEALSPEVFFYLMCVSSKTLTLTNFYYIHRLNLLPLIMIPMYQHLM